MGELLTREYEKFTQVSADSTEAFATVEVTRKGKGAEIFMRHDTWNQTVQGWRLRQTVS